MFSIIKLRKQIKKEQQTHQPKIVQHYIKHHRYINPELWTKLKELRICQHCRKQFKRPLQIHHITPIKKGGTNLLENLQSLCPSCHFTRDKKHKEYKPKYAVGTLIRFLFREEKYKYKPEMKIQPNTKIFLRDEDKKLLEAIKENVTVLQSCLLIDHTDPTLQKYYMYMGDALEGIKTHINKIYSHEVK